MAAELDVEVATGQAEIACLTTETGKLRDQVNGKTLLGHHFEVSRQAF
jgi:hypothetical protein